MSKWNNFGKVCAGIGVAMSAMSSSFNDVLPHPYDNIYLAAQTGIIALGVYAIAQGKADIEADVKRSKKR